MFQYSGMKYNSILDSISIVYLRTIFLSEIFFIRDTEIYFNSNMKPCFVTDASKLDYFEALLWYEHTVSMAE